MSKKNAIQSDSPQQPTAWPRRSTDLGSFTWCSKREERRLLVPHSTGPHRKRGIVLLFECHGGHGGAGRPRSPRRHRPPQCTTSAHAWQLHSEYVNLKPYRMTKKEIVIAKLLAKNFERFGHTITPQRRRGALLKVAQDGGLRLVHASPI
jgi:hypothetical protein